jgi:hypothetical protein
MISVVTIILKNNHFETTRLLTLSMVCIRTQQQQQQQQQQLNEHKFLRATTFAYRFFG